MIWDEELDEEMGSSGTDGSREKGFYDEAMGFLH